MTSGTAGARIVVVNPELEAFLPLIPELDLNDPVAARTKYAEQAAAKPAWDDADMEIEDRTVTADPDVPVRIYRPRRAHGAIVWLHGGGFVVGDVDTEHLWAARIADGSGAVVISVGYRLAPEHRFPAALDDAYAALAWTADHAVELGIDPERIAVGGHSAGAGLAAAVALRARDQHGPSIHFQLLNEPELDDRQKPGRHETSPIRHGRIATSSPHRGGTTSVPRPPRPTPRRRGQPTFRSASRLRRHRRVRPESR
jgi:acetyl esterase